MMDNQPLQLSRLIDDPQGSLFTLTMGSNHPEKMDLR